jgi:hypothetical protein
MKMRISLFMISALLYHTVKSQSRTGLEEYYYAGNSMASALVTRAWYQSDNHWYGEIRYNYENAKSYSLYGGRTFSKNGDLSWSVTAFGGLVMGRYKGFSTGTNVDMRVSKLYFSSDSQYTRAAGEGYPDFFYAWSELGYQVSSRLFGGLALQQTRYFPSGGKWELGMEAGISFKSWSIPLYLFNPAGRERYVVLGITWEGSSNSSTRSIEKL